MAFLRQDDLQKSDKPIAEHIATLVPYGKIYSCYSRSNPMRLFTLNFYLGDRIVPFDAFMPTEGYLIAGPEDANSFLEENKEYQLKQIYDSKHRSCDDHKIIGLYQFKKFEQ